MQVYGYQKKLLCHKGGEGKYYKSESSANKYKIKQITSYI